MQAQLTASARVARIGRVFLQLNMGFKYRPPFLSPCVLRVCCWSLCRPCKTTESSVFCRGKRVTWKEPSDFIFQHSRQTDQSFIFLELCTVQSNSIFPPGRLWAVCALQQFPLWKCRLLSGFVSCFSCRRCLSFVDWHSGRCLPLAFVVWMKNAYGASWQAFKL